MDSVAQAELRPIGKRPGGRRTVAALRGEAAAVLAAAVCAVTDGDIATARSDFAALTTDELDAATVVLARTLGVLSGVREARG